jgi:hypothetical protein
MFTAGVAVNNRLLQADGKRARGHVPRAFSYAGPGLCGKSRIGGWQLIQVKARFAGLFLSEGDHAHRAWPTTGARPVLAFPGAPVFPLPCPSCLAPAWPGAMGQKRLPQFRLVFGPKCAMIPVLVAMLVMLAVFSTI